MRWKSITWLLSLGLIRMPPAPKKAGRFLFDHKVSSATNHWGPLDTKLPWNLCRPKLPFSKFKKTMSCSWTTIFFSLVNLTLDRKSNHRPERFLKQTQWNKWCCVFKCEILLEKIAVISRICAKRSEARAEIFELREFNRSYFNFYLLKVPRPQPA